MRYIFNNAPEWSEEFSLFIITYVVFLAGRVALKRGQHVGITFIVDMIPGGLGVLIRSFSYIGTLFFMLVLAWQSYKLSIFFQNFTAPATGISMFWLYISLPVGSFLMAVEAFLLLIQEIAKLKLAGTPQSTERKLS